MAEVDIEGERYTQLTNLNVTDNLRLNGVLISNLTTLYNGDSSIEEDRLASVINDSSLNFQQFADGVGTGNASNFSVKGTVSLSNLGTQIIHATGDGAGGTTGQTGLFLNAISPALNFFLDDANSAGLQYAADYSVGGLATYGARWIPDYAAVQAYSDTKVASVTSGTNITVDNADPVNPIINLNAAISGVSVNGVTLSNAGSITNYLAEDGTYQPVPVVSVFGRTGVVSSVAGDYNASQVNNDSGVSGAFVSDALNALDTTLGGKVDSVSGGANINITGTASNPVVNLDASITGVTVNGVTLSAAGSSTNFLNEAGGYSEPTRTLQQAYEDGNTIDVDSVNGKVQIDNSSETIAGLRLVPNSTFPTTSLEGGDLQMDADGTLYSYDSTRSKFLTVNDHQFTFAENGGADDEYLRVGFMSDTDAGYIMPFDGTIVAITADSSGGTNNKGFEAQVNGVDVINFNLSSGQYLDTTEDTDFSAGDRLQVFCVSAGGNVQDPVVSLFIKWRK